MADLRFIYVVSDKWKEHLRYEWLYVYRMSKFYQWWIKKKFRLYYNVRSDVMLVLASRLTRWRFGIDDLVRDHREKGNDIYHIYLSYFKPLVSDCSVGYYMDNFGLVKWDYYNPKKGNIIKFLADENCSKVSHIILHEMIRHFASKRDVRKRYHDAIHEQWRKHMLEDEEYEYYNDRYERVSKDSNYTFATMKIPKMK